MAGAFLQQPDLTKLSEESQLSNLKFGSSQMQGNLCCFRNQLSRLESEYGGYSSYKIQYRS